MIEYKPEASPHYHSAAIERLLCATKPKNIDAYTKGVVSGPDWWLVTHFAACLILEKVLGRVELCHAPCVQYEDLVANVQNCNGKSAVADDASIAGCTGINSMRNHDPAFNGQLIFVSTAIACLQGASCEGLLDGR